MATVEHAVFGLVDVAADSWPQSRNVEKTPANPYDPGQKVVLDGPEDSTDEPADPPPPDTVVLDGPLFPDKKALAEFEDEANEALSIQLKEMGIPDDEEEEEGVTPVTPVPTRVVSKSSVGSFARGHRPAKVTLDSPEEDGATRAKPSNRLTILPEHVKALKAASRIQERRFTAFMYSRAIPVLMAIDSGTASATAMLRDVLGTGAEPDLKGIQALEAMAFGSLKLEYLATILQDLNIPEEVKIHILKAQGDALVNALKAPAGPSGSAKDHLGGKVGYVARWPSGQEPPPAPKPKPNKRLKSR